MHSTKPLLSICIPTYNRPDELTETLRILAKQFASLRDADRQVIEVVVSDNHSNVGDIQAVVTPFAEAGLPVSLHVQERNLGPTLNFEFCYRRAMGGFVFILSDDDHLCDGSLSWILSTLKKYSPDILFLPFFAIPTHLSGNSSEREMKMERNDFLARVGLLPTLLSACIIKREHLEPNFGRYLETSMHHYYYFLCALEEGQSFIYMNQQVLYSPYSDNSGGYNWFSAFANDFYRVIDEFPAHKISKSVLATIKRNMFVDRIIPHYVNTRINGYTISERFVNIPHSDLVKLISKRCILLKEYWLLFLPLLILPTILLKWTKVLYVAQKEVFFKWH